MNFTLLVWRQKNAQDKGGMVTYQARGIEPDMSFLEMLDVVNNELVEKGEEPIAFDHDCREGICGSCSLMINGRAHGPERGTASCQTFMRLFKDGDHRLLARKDEMAEEACRFFAGHAASAARR